MMRTGVAARRTGLAPLWRAAVMTGLAMIIVTITACRVETAAPEGVGAATAEPTATQATPQPTRSDEMPSGVTISYEMHPSVDCAVAIEYRALFLIDQTGTNSTGTWDYVERPAITVVQVSGATG